MRGTIAFPAASCQADPNHPRHDILLFLKRLFQSQPKRAEAVALYGALARRARLPAFYAGLGVPDSVDGRFEMLCIHAHALFHRLRGGDAAAEQLAQAVYDAMFEDLDGALRELGAADLGVGRRIKIMTEALKGRIDAYDTALAATGPGAEEALRAALGRNAYGTVKAEAAQIAAMAGYLRDLRATLAACEISDLLAGRIGFPAAPEAPVKAEQSDASR
jgi:cytochrome b pre-mRNA-processing protein 3